MIDSDEFRKAVLKVIKDEMSIQIKVPGFYESHFTVQLMLGDEVFAEDYLDISDIEYGLERRGCND
jgi:hypothetical protein